jgi:transcription elongation factor Elf1
MVEVIKHGEKNIVECDFCGAQLRYSVDDLKEQERYLSQRDSYPEKYIVCPDCNSYVMVIGFKYCGTV